jgi:phosphopantetheinyl transferase (holo-ACP synthase)
MENEIKKIYNTLSGGKIISYDNYMISSSHFNSISADRFISELNKRGINWDGTDIPFSVLIKNNKGNSNSSIDVNPNIEIISSSNVLSTSQIGIDIQDISELPDSIDFWEDEFYISKFKKEEIAYCIAKDNPKQSFAGLYSCKEALIKCNHNLKWQDIYITHDEIGKPQFENYIISISHSGFYTLSVAFKLIIEPNNVIENKENENEIERTLFGVSSKDENTKNISIIVLFTITILTILYIIYRDFVIN